MGCRPVGIPPQRLNALEALFDSRLAPVLFQVGLVEDRNRADGAFCCSGSASNGLFWLQCHEMSCLWESVKATRLYKAYSGQQGDV